MRVSRRAVVGAALAAPTVVGLEAVAGSAAAAEVAPYARSTWKPHLGRRFTLRGNGVRGRAVLTSIDDVAGGSSRAAHRFSLVFTGDADLPEGLVSVSRPGFGPVSLFVTSVDRGVEAQHRQAVVNRI